MTRIFKLIAAIGLVSASTVFVPAQAQAQEQTSEARLETASFATYTPSMAARGQRFYVGP
jgi:hypothetical protein